MAIESVSNGSMTRDEFHEREKAAFLAGEGIEEEKPAAKAEPAPGDSDDSDEETEVEAKSDDATEQEADETAGDETDVDAKPDGETSKRLEQLRKTEARHREQIKRDREQFEAERGAFVAEWKEKVAAAERFESLKGRLSGNPYAIVDLLIEAGVSEDDFEAAAQAAYAHSTKGKAEPKNREVIARSKRERELADELKQIKSKLEAREQQERQQREQAEMVERANRIVDGFVKEVKAEKAPLLAAALAKNPERTRGRITQIASDLYDRDGQMPSASAVHAEYERLRREELAELDIDPATIKAPAKVATTAKAAAKATGAKKAAEPERPPTKAEILAEMEELERQNKLS